MSGSSRAIVQNRSDAITFRRIATVAMNLYVDATTDGLRAISLAGLMSVLLFGAVQAQPTLYWSNTLSGSIQRSVVGSGIVDDVIEGFVERPHSLRLDVEEGKLYWAIAVEPPTPGGAALQKSNLDGSSLENILLTGACNPYCPVTAMTLDAEGDSLYWSTWDGTFPATHTLYRSDLQGSETVPVGSSDNVVLDIHLDRGTRQLYWIDGKLPDNLADHAIVRAGLGGSEPEQILLVFDGKPPEEGNLAVDPDGGHVYWVTRTRAIRRANLDGSGIEDLVGIDGDPDSTRFGDLALDVVNGKMYWSVTYGGVNTFPVGVIHRANLDGSEIEELVRVDPGSIGAFAIDFSRLVGRETQPSSAYGFSLGQAYPNPALRSVTIPYTLTRAAHTTLDVWDLLGRRVKVVSGGIQAPGARKLVLQVSDLPSGVYLYRLRSGGLYRSGTLIIR